MKIDRYIERAQLLVPVVDQSTPADESPSIRDSRWAVPRAWLWATAGALMLLVCAIYGQTIDHEFLRFDDDVFVYSNPHVSQGFTRGGLIWAFTDGPYHEWYPLASLSHMFDCQLFGVDPAAAHLHNLVLHAAAAILLFLVLLRLTNQRAVPGTDRRLVAAQASGARVPPAGLSATTPQRAVPEAAQASGARVPPAGLSATTPQRAVPEAAQASGARVPPAGLSATTPQRAVPEAAQASGARVAPAGLSATTPQRAVPEAAQASGARVAPAGLSATTLWPSAWAAAVFAVHPLHVSSVAWVSERRELLGGIFFMLTLWAYVRYVERRTLSRYLTVTGCLAVGLLSKGILVTVPCVLLLLDYWPLGRWRAPGHAPSEADDRWRFGRLPRGWQLIVEKLPLFGLVAVDCAIVFWKHLESPVVAMVDPIPFSFRVGNALVAYAAYVGQTFVPIGLSPYYPHLGARLPLAWVCEALAVLVPITVVAAIFWRRLPFVIVGWLWFLGMLVPVLGLVGWFLQARADNYTYLSQIGLSIAVAWSVWHFYHWRKSRGTGPWLAWSLVGTSGVVVLVLAAVAWRQTTYWRTTESVWLRAASCTQQSELAHYVLGWTFEDRDRLDEAIAQYEQALLLPSISRNITAQVHARLAYCLVQQHRQREAFEHLWAGLQIDPEAVSRDHRLDDVLNPSGMLDETADRWRDVVRLLPDWVNLRLALADALLARGKPGDVEEAFAHFNDALTLDPKNSRIHFRLGLALLDRGQGRSAVEHLLTAVEIAPDDVPMLTQTAWILATHPDPSVRDGARAAELADHAMQEGGNDNPQVLDVLAAAQAEIGEFDTAILMAQAAAVLARGQNKLELAAAIVAHLHEYEQGQAYRDHDR